MSIQEQDPYDFYDAHKNKIEAFDFYDSTTLKSYNLDKLIRYQLNLLGSLDIYTKKHCENVANITCRLCKYLHCSKNFTIYCTTCAYLHDIGKIFIPTEILQKPSRLTDEEYTIMKTHTTLGANLCNTDPNLKIYSAGPLYHHEALNGSGYPNGLTKKDIPYEGQIIRVADEYDAIVNKRQYKSHVGISDTLKILIEDSKPEASSAFPTPTYGKNNPLIVKKLFKVVIEDIEYEIYCTYDYVNKLKAEIERLEQIMRYEDKMNSAKSQKKKEYYLSGINMLLTSDETLDNYRSLYNEYQDAYAYRKAHINNLFNEIKIIKKLRV
jgi:hypothetical protein